jgi:hypothetical protein
MTSNPSSNTASPAEAPAPQTSTQDGSTQPAQTAAALHAAMLDQLALIRNKIQGAMQDIEQWREQQAIKAESERLEVGVNAILDRTNRSPLIPEMTAQQRKNRARRVTL